MDDFKEFKNNLNELIKLDFVKINTFGISFAALKKDDPIDVEILEPLDHILYCFYRSRRKVVKFIPKAARGV